MSQTGSPTFVCAKCGKGFRRKDDLARHARIHDPDAERFHCSFPGCTHSSLQKGNLKTHYTSKHLQLRNHRCSFYGCDKSYTDASALIRHEKLVHRFFRRTHKPYARTAVKKEKVEPDLDPELLAFVTATTPSHDYSSSGVPSRVSAAFPATPAPTTPSSFEMPSFGPSTFNRSNPFEAQTQIMDASSRASTAFHAAPSFGMTFPGPPSFNWSNPFEPQTPATSTFMYEMVSNPLTNPALHGQHSGSFALPHSNANPSYTYPLSSFPQYNFPIPNVGGFMIPNVPRPY